MSGIPSNLNVAFEGYLTDAPAEKVKMAFRKGDNIGVPLQLKQIPDTALWAVFRKDVIYEVEFRELVKTVAKDISLDLGRVLVVRVDDSKMHQSAILYVHGELKESFGPSEAALELALAKLNPTCSVETLYRFMKNRW